MSVGALEFLEGSFKVNDFHYYNGNIHQNYS